MRSIPNKLPNVGTTIFTVMSKLAADEGALNLAQGFPSFGADPALLDLVNEAMRANHNQYAPMAGVPVLREAIAQKTLDCYGVSYDPNTEITVTSGATEALFAAITTVVQSVSSQKNGPPGPDEAIVFEPAYDAYVPAIELAGGKPVYVSLTPPHYAIDWAEVAGKITKHTRLIVVNTPHNPTGRVWTTHDVAELARLAEQHNLFVVADEVYEHITFDRYAGAGRVHHSLMQHPVLYDRTFVIGSFGKTFHITGWKIGYCLAPKPLTDAFRKIHQFLTFSVSTPMQYALATYLQNPEPYRSLSAFYEKKRDVFLAAIASSRFVFTPSEGTFFQNVSYADITHERDDELAIRLTREIGVAAIPVSVFYHQKTDYKILRFCFAKDDDILREAGARLTKWSKEEGVQGLRLASLAKP